MSRFKLSNNIFKSGLSANEMAVYAYMCSLPTETPTFNGSAIKVKQSTIAQKCGIKAVQTVSKIISRLAEKGFIEPLKRSIKANKHKGTYTYIINKMPTSKDFFFVDRYIFGRLVPRQIMIYLFICKCYSPVLNDCWNSYNDISEQTGIKRETIIQTINELSEMKFIVRNKRKSKENKRVFVDNHYQLVFYVKGTFRGKKTVRLHSHTNRTKDLKKSIKKQHYNSTILSKCQDFLQNFFSCRGSPQN